MKYMLLIHSDESRYPKMSEEDLGQLMAAYGQFTAEIQDIQRFSHYKQIEKLAGTNVRIKDSGQYKGKRRMSKIGNCRLRRRQSKAGGRRPGPP